MPPIAFCLSLLLTTILVGSGTWGFSSRGHGLFLSRSPSELFAAGGGAGPRSESSGPRGDARRGRRSSSQRERLGTFTATTTTRKRAPYQFDHTKEEARPFVDAWTEVQQQPPNEDAPVYDGLDSSGDVIEHAHVETKSLDELFPGLGFSKLFSSSTAFRKDIRSAMRADIFDTTPTYHGMSEKARSMLLLPDSSLQGSWKCKDGGWSWANDNAEVAGSDGPRMRQLTAVLKKHLGENAPSGDDFMDTIGSLCGSKPSTHWIDIVGVSDRRIPHSWHHDTGKSLNGDTKTVLLGFPTVDNYQGVGVFSHLIKLKHEQQAADEHPPNEPVLYPAAVDSAYIMRPVFAEGREIIMYRDIDVLHSAPDVTYRDSVMRFM